jgi:hypothetical protein
MLNKAYYYRKMKSYTSLVGKLKAKRLLGRPDNRWNSNIKMEYKELRCKHVDWLRVGTTADVLSTR